MTLNTRDDPAITGCETVSKGNEAFRPTHCIDQYLRQRKGTHSIKREPLMPDQDGSQLILVGQFSQTLKRHKKNGQEGGTAKREGRVGRVLLVVECTSGNQSLKDGAAVFRS